MLVDQHLHLEKGPYTPHDYPLAWLDAYLEVAGHRGLSRLGVVEHAYRFVEAKGLLDNPWADARCRFELARYVAFVEKAKASGVPVSFGLEMDYVPGKEEGIGAFLGMYPWDFVLGSVHYVGDVGVDNADDRRRTASWPRRKIWDGYFEASHQAVRSGLFDVLTHPDLPKIFGEQAEHDLTDNYRALAADLRAAGMAIEYNTAGWRKPVAEAYPQPAFLEAALRRGVPVSLASDAHLPADVGAGFDDAVRVLSDVGYREAVHFVARERFSAPLPPNSTARAAT